MFQTGAYYKEWAIRCIKEVDTRWLDYDTVWKAICHKTGNLHDIFNSYGHYEWFSNHADDYMADKAMELDPNLFDKTSKTISDTGKTDLYPEREKGNQQLQIPYRAGADDERGLYGTGQKRFVLSRYSIGTLDQGTCGIFHRIRP